MFSHLTSQLRAEVETIQKVLVINDAIRDLLIAKSAVLIGLTDFPEAADDLTQSAYALGRLVRDAPNKLDWQIYDHCAALTRLYAVYDRYIGELVSGYVALLPQLYIKYSDLPSAVATQHRIGIGTILLKIGEKGPYKNLEEQVVVRELAAGLSGASEYKLLADAFFIDRQNLRFDMLCRLFSAIGFKQCGRFIHRHSAIVDFIRTERADTSSAEKELDDFIEYRNEAAHRRVENVLGTDAIGVMGRFVVALGQALADMVEEGVLRRRMELNHYSDLIAINEVHYNGQVVIGTLATGAALAVGEEVVLFGPDVSQRVKVDNIEINNQAVENVIGDGLIEVGCRLNKRAKPGFALRRLRIPAEPMKEIQLQLEEAMPSMVDQADTDIGDAIESQDAAGAVESPNQSEHTDIEGESQGPTERG